MRARDLCVLFVISVSLALGAATPNRQADTVETSKGPLKITPLFGTAPEAAVREAADLDKSVLETAKQLLVPTLCTLLAPDLTKCHPLKLASCCAGIGKGRNVLYERSDCNASYDGQPSCRSNRI
jgi:hypothetical protein